MIRNDLLKTRRVAIEIPPKNDVQISKLGPQSETADPALLPFALRPILIH